VFCRLLTPLLASRAARLDGRREAAVLAARATAGGRAGGGVGGGGGCGWNETEAEVVPTDPTKAAPPNVSDERRGVAEADEACVPP